MLDSISTEHFEQTQQNCQEPNFLGSIVHPGTTRCQAFPHEDPEKQCIGSQSHPILSPSKIPFNHQTSPVQVTQALTVLSFVSSPLELEQFQFSTNEYHLR